MEEIQNQNRELVSAKAHGVFRRLGSSQYNERPRRVLDKQERISRARFEMPQQIGNCQVVVIHKCEILFYFTSLHNHTINIV